MLKVEETSGDLQMTGVVSPPERLWPHRREQHFFVNQRRVYHRSVPSTIYRAYGESLQGRHPCYLLLLSLPPRLVDVNVHPAKKEVRFRDEERVSGFVYHAVQKALFGRGRGQPAASVAGPERFDYAQRPTPALTMAESQAAFEFGVPGREGDAAAAASKETPPSSLVPCWQLHGRYILSSIKSGLIIIDQHAAHERILYEEILGRSGHSRSQQLLFPTTVELSASEFQTYLQYRETFAQLGFDIREFGGRTLIVEGLPHIVSEADISGIIVKVLHDLDGSAPADWDPRQRLARSFACHAAVKAGQELGPEEMNRLIDRLFATTTPYLDPHGRPAVIKITLEDLDRRFGRI